MATGDNRPIRARRTLVERLRDEVEYAERLRKQAEEHNERIWREARTSEELLRRIRLRWFGDDHCREDPKA